MSPRRLTTCVVGLALLLSTTTVPSQAAPPPTPPTGPATTSPAAARITLITGDGVRVVSRPGRPEHVTFEPGRSSRSTSAVTTFAGGHTYVVPSAAAADVASARLDRSLFDVTTLIAERRDDANSPTIPVIVKYAGTPTTARGRAARTPVPGAARSRVLTSIGAKAAAITKNSTRGFWESITTGPTARVSGAIQRVTLDRQVKVNLDQSVPQIGGPAAWQRGLTGTGIKIAVLDTGIDPSHPDLAGRVAASRNFSDAADTVDRQGHGTHVAGIAAGDGTASGGRTKGVAPDATLLNGKVLNDFGFGNFSDIIAGMEWAAAEGADVVNLSLGGSDPSDGTDDVSLALNRLSNETGTLFVVAAGNCFFPEPGSVTSPAAADLALAVGNLERDGGLNESSCRGPRAVDGALKPELSAPGTDIVAPRAADTQLGTPVGDNYTTATGTSMAAPHVAGTAALVAQAHPDWKAAQLKARLMSTADPRRTGVDEEGAGRVDADQATDRGVTVDTGELELGKLLWPFPAQDEVSRELTYRNPGSTAVTLELSAALTPAAATPKLSAGQLVVPANGEAKVTVTADRAAAGAGTFSGRITATAQGADPLVTTIGWYAEPERYDLTIKGIAADGGVAEGNVALATLDGDPVDTGDFGLRLENGSAKIRLAPGRYVASSVFFTDATDTKPTQVDLVATGEIQVTKDGVALLDTRKAKALQLTARDAQGLATYARSMSYAVKGSDGTFETSTGVLWHGAEWIYRATPTAKLSTGSAEFAMGARLEVPPYRAQVVGAQSIAMVPFEFGPRFTGTKKLALVDAGAATATELRTVKGKLALIRRDDADPRFVGNIVKAAQEAGAAAVIVYNPDQPAGGMFWAYNGEGPEPTIPAMSTTRAAAGALLRQLATGPVTVKVTGQAATPYVYDLFQPFPDRIPSAGRVMVERSHLARIQETFGAQKAGTRTSESRSGSTELSDFSPWTFFTFATPGRRTSYVQANSTRWSNYLVIDNGGQNYGLNSAERTYTPGERGRFDWFRPIYTSGLPIDAVSRDGVRRRSSGLQVFLSPFQNGLEYADGFDDFDSELVIERNGEQVTSTPGSSAVIDVPADAADYRVKLNSPRGTDVWRYPGRIESDWAFRSRGGDREVMPLVFADLAVPSADSASQVKVGQPTPITLRLRHQAGAGTTAEFTTAKLELSYDGQQWSDLPLTPTTSGTYTTTVTHLPAQAGRAPSLRITAEDANGNKLVQKVTEGYGLIR